MKYDENASRGLTQAYLSPAIVRSRERVVDELKLQEGEAVLDVGSGPGFLAHALSERVGSSGLVLGIDTSESMIGIATDHCRDCTNVQFSLGEAASIDAEDESFDAITCLQVLLYVTDVEAALAEMWRVLRPGGRLAIIETDWKTLLVAGADADVTLRVFGAWDAEVPSPALPVRLPVLLHAAGFGVRTIDAIPLVDSVRERGSFADLTLRSCSQIAHRNGVITDQELHDWTRSLASAVATATYFFSVNRYLFVAERNSR